MACRFRLGRIRKHNVDSAVLACVHEQQSGRDMGNARVRRAKLGKHGHASWPEDILEQLHGTFRRTGIC